jgi:hypothetical protein
MRKLRHYARMRRRAIGRNDAPRSVAEVLLTRLVMMPKAVSATISTICAVV